MTEDVNVLQALAITDDVIDGSRFCEWSCEQSMTLETWSDLLKG